LGSTISGSDQDPPAEQDVVISPWEEHTIDLPMITDDSERVRAVWVSPQGVQRVEDDEQRRVDVPVAMLVSDRRVVFVARGGDDESPSGTYTLAYSDLAGVDVDVDGEHLVMTTTAGVVWRVPLPSERSADHDSVLRHLRWLGALRNRIVSCRSDVELAAGEIREHAHALDWGRARTSYDEVREELDALVCDVQLVEPVSTAHLAPELGELERQLERAHTRLYIERAKAALAMGRHLIQDENYGSARERLREAQRFYDRARAQSDAARRGDAFQFGPQRELQDDLENLGWEIETVAAEPIRQAHEAKIEAQFLDDPAESLDRWETALRRYGHVLTLRWDDDGRNFAGDPAEVRQDRELAAERIVEVREQLAKQQWNAGATHQEQGDNAAALEQCSRAVDHLERVLELAEEFDVADPSAIAGRLERMQSVVDTLREHVAGGQPVDEQPDPGGPDVAGSGFVGRYEGAGGGDAVDSGLDGDPPRRSEHSNDGSAEHGGGTTERNGPDHDADGGNQSGTDGNGTGQSEPNADGSGRTGEGDPSGETLDVDVPSIGSLSNLDLHPEITLETDAGALGSTNDDSADGTEAGSAREEIDHTDDDGSRSEDAGDGSSQASSDVRHGAE